jgi:hypothetical protein
VKTRLFLNKPDILDKGQYVFFDDSQVGYDNSDGLPLRVDKFAGKDLYSTVIENRENDIIVDGALDFSSDSFIRIDHIRIHAEDVVGWSTNKNYKAYIMDKAYFENRGGDINSGWYDGWTGEGILSALDYGDSIYGVTKEMFLWNSYDTEDARGETNPDDGYVLRDQIIAQNLISGETFLPDDFTNDSDIYTGEGLGGASGDWEALFLDSDCDKILCAGVGQKIYIMISLESDAWIYVFGNEDRPDLYYVFEIDVDTLYENKDNGDAITTITFGENDAIVNGTWTRTNWSSALTPEPGLGLTELKVTINLGTLEDFDDNLTDEQLSVSELLRPAQTFEIAKFDEGFCNQHPHQSIHALNFGSVNEPIQYNFDVLPKVKVNNIEDYDLRAYQSSSLNQEICSAPNELTLDFDLTEHIQPTEDYDIDIVDYPYDKLKFKFYVVDWDDEDDKFVTDLDFLNDKPQDVFELIRKRQDGVYYFSDLGTPLNHRYLTPGIKKIKAVLFSHTDVDYNYTEIVRWKFISTRIYLGRPISEYPDFSELGGVGYNVLPWPHTTPIIGGTNENSNYSISIENILSGGKIGDTDIIDEQDLVDASENDETGKSIVNLDLQQVRYFSESYDMHQLLGIRDNIITPNGFKPFFEYDWWNCNDWDTERNYCFSDETSVGEIFIDDNLDRTLVQKCEFEFNSGQTTYKSIYDSSGNTNKGLLVGDYKIKKREKGKPMKRDSFIKTPKKGSKSDGAL